MRTEALSPHGFCAGVTGALRKALALVPDPVGKDALYCLHELVHNELVVSDLKARGFTFVDSVEGIPEGATVLFSAHGVSPAVRRAAEVRRLKVVDATCPFVARVHRAARAFAARGLDVLVIGNPDHAEVRGIVGEVEEAGGRALVLRSRDEARAFEPAGDRPFGVVSQTTVNADEVSAIVAVLRGRFPVETMAEVCQATKERQDAVRRFEGDALLVLGSANSSNTRRLCEVAPCRTFRAGTLEDVAALDLIGVKHLGVTSGASTPESFFSKALGMLKEKAGKMQHGAAASSPPREMAGRFSANSSGGEDAPAPLSARLLFALALFFPFVSLPQSSNPAIQQSNNSPHSSHSAVTQIVDGVAYVCQDGMCMPVGGLFGEKEEVKGEKAKVRGEGAKVRVLEGYCSPEEFLKFLSNNPTIQQSNNPTIPSSPTSSLSWLFLAFGVLLGGLALNLTPCVLPMMPVTLIVVGRSAVRGAAYGLGMAVSYGLLGLAAALGGLAFGTIQSSPWFNLFVAAVFVALGLSLWGRFAIDFTRARPRVAKPTSASLLFPFFMGCLAAVLAGACVAPVLIAVLVLTADLVARGSLLALALPFLLGLGMALPWPFAGAGMSFLPRPGAWMRHVNRLFALLVFAFAAWYAVLAVRGFLPERPSDGAYETPETFPAALARAKRPVLVDCFASWCKNCAAMERTTLRDPRVVEALKGCTVIRLRAEDLTALRGLKDFPPVRGLPAFLIFE